MSQISVYIIAYNEADKIRSTIQSVLWADEIIVVDSSSTDGTIEIAEGLGARVVQVAFSGFGNLRNAALAACSHDWILSLDSDERCTPDVAAEIRHIMQSPTSVDVYRVPRRNFFMGRWIKHSGWYPNFRQPQLFRKNAMGYDTKPVHEGYILQTSKPLGTLKAAIWQYPFKSFDEFIHKLNRYSTLGVTKIEHKNPSMGMALTHGVWAFLRHYVFKLGVLDGWAGFVIALGYFEQTFYRYAKATAKIEGWSEPPQP